MQNKFLENYQYMCRKGLWIQKHVDPISHCALGLAGETGEVCDMVKKEEYDPPKEYSQLDMIHELGDVLWYLTNIADQHGVTLAEIVEANIKKLSLRHAGKAVYSVEALQEC